MKKPILLAILDGYGIAPDSNANAISKANTKNIDYLTSNYPTSVLEASGEAVGLPEGQIGNSEVGHLTIGAGRTIFTGLTKINKSIENGTFSQNKRLLEAINYAKTNNSKVHIIGLLSPGGVHSHENHIFELIKTINSQGVKSIVHAITDGRDVEPRSCIPSIKKLEQLCSENNSTIATIAGRYYAMDRDKRWDRVEKAYEAILGKAENKFNNLEEYINLMYSKDINDEFIEPAMLDSSSDNFLNDNDVVIFANFRPDRARELSHIIYKSNYYDFEPTSGRKSNLYFAIMMPYEGIEPNTILYPNEEIKNTLGHVIANNNLKQLRIAETEKYAHVTFFFDGGVEIDFPNEKKILIDSPKVPDYKQTPKMSATTITNQLLEVINEYDLIILNFANPDMIGHTGDFQATVEAIQWIDYLIGVIYEKINELGGTMFITADHGNADRMLDENNKVVTAHSINDVPFICTDKNIQLKEKGKLSNIAPTILDYMGIEKPAEMDEESLIIR